MNNTIEDAIPTEQDAIHIVESALGKTVTKIERFSTGLMHYVYDTTTSDGEKLVVRLTIPKHSEFFNAAVHWYLYLKEKGIPLPKIYFSETDSNMYRFPVMIMERLPGTDLGNIYEQLSIEQKHTLAKQIAEIQRTVAGLPAGHGYGYAFSYNDTTLKTRWIDVLVSSIERSKTRLKIPDEGYSEKVKQAVHQHERYFSQVEPLCFLDDTTTKNVIIAPDGTLSGIVDFDSMAFGDPLYALGLTRASLLSKGYDTDYTDFWEKERNVTEDERHAIRLYTAVFALDFLSEMGNTFNKNTANAVEKEQVSKLFEIIDSNVNT